MKKALVIGAARSGSAVSKLLIENHYDVYLTDQKEIGNKTELENLGIKVYEKGHPDILKTIDYDLIVKNPGIPYHAPFIKYFVDHNKMIVTEIEVAYLFSPNFEYGAITGTNGKTTITSILYALLKYNGKALVAGNIGTPLSECVMNCKEEHKQVAIELSNFQLLGVNKFKPHIAVVCNLSPDHLDYMGSVEKYYKSKMMVYKNQTKDDYFLRNVDDAEVMKYAKDIPSTIVDFSLQRQDVDLFLKDKTVYYHDVELFNIDILNIVGKHNVSNAMIAACMAYLMGVSLENIRIGLSEFKSVEHRLEYIGECHGIKYFNDSKATNPEAVVPALNAFEKNIILLAGGYDKKLPFDILKPFDSRIKCCLAFGETKNSFESIFTHVNMCDDMKEAFIKANEIANSGDVILLSPACASYDQFKSYEERGEIFKRMVNEYINNLERGIL